MTFLRKWIIWFWSAKLLWNDTAVASENSTSAAATRRVSEAGDQQDAASELDGHGDGESQRREGQSHGTDHLSREPIGTEFAEAAHGEGKADQHAAGEGKITGGVHGICSLLR